MMGDILQDIVACKKEEVRRFRQTLPDREIHAMAERDMERGDGAERPSMRHHSRVQAQVAFGRMDKP